MIILKKYIKIFMMIQLIVILARDRAFAQTMSDSVATPITGYIDENKDGINDIFCDANGDGINDVDKLPYRHTFRFEDANNDKVNDLWRDEDGDGVNDLMKSLLKRSGFKPKSAWVDMDGDGIRDKTSNELEGANLRTYVLDADNDGINDITGGTYDENFVQGYRYGFIDEERGERLDQFIDADNDCMHDRYTSRLSDELKRNALGRRGNKNFDYFIDNDGDGICDERGLSGLGRKGSGKRHGKKNSN